MREALPFSATALSCLADMKPIINLEERIGKMVGRRSAPADSFEYGMQLQRTGGELSRTLGVSRIPKGVFRFHSHEEADAWMMKHLTKAEQS
jgi:hypothetical protein